MKRLNPKTEKPFKKWEIREDGKIFKSYDLRNKTKNGFFYERWGSKATMENRTKYQKSWWRSPKGRTLVLLGAAKHRAKKSKMPFKLNAKDIQPILEKGFCQLTNLKFDFTHPKKTQYNPYSPSLDRIDSKKGYVKENVRVVLSSINTALGEHGQDVMLPILEAMVKGIKKNATKTKTARLPAQSNRKS